MSFQSQLEDYKRMKRITFRLSVAVLTFLVGLTSVWLISVKPKTKKVVPQKPIEVSTTMPEPERPRFMPTIRGCGMGYFQGYELPDGQTMSEGTAAYSTSREAKKELRQMLARASTIVERVPAYKNRFGDEGERIVALFPPDENGKAWASIIWYGGGKNFWYIDAPSLELAREFEISNAYRY
jgi:hypothetical protein